jgi:hypothetical protein
MKIVGLVTVTIAGLAGLAGVVVGVRSIPDLRRYMKIRAM